MTSRSLSLRTALAAVLSLATARMLRFPEAYWSAVTTVVVMQSTLGAAWQVSTRRFLGTAIGALFGGLLMTTIDPGYVAFGIGIFLLGILCGALRLDVSAYRFAALTFAIIALASRLEPAPTLALHRFVEVSTGIMVALLVSAVWPSREP